MTNTKNQHTPQNNSGNNKSFFETISLETIFQFWNDSDTLLELAYKCGFNDQTGLKRIDYEYIQQIKTRDQWKSIYDRHSKNGSDKS